MVGAEFASNKPTKKIKTQAGARTPRGRRAPSGHMHEKELLFLASLKQELLYRLFSALSCSTK